MPKVYKLFLYTTLQMIKDQFHYDQSVSSLAFEHEIYLILTEINPYIPRFVTRTVKPNRSERGFIFGVALSVNTALFSAWRFYKAIIFKQNLYRTLTYIFHGQKNFRNGILINKCNLLSLAEITSSNFKNLKSYFHMLEGTTSRKFDHNITSILHSYADSVFYKKSYSLIPMSYISSNMT